MADAAAAAVGLDSSQVRAARREHGLNQILPEVSRNWRDVWRDAARDPMPWFLLLTAALFGLLGQHTEALILAIALLPLLGMDVYLYRRTVASTAGLAGRLAASARAMRDGAWTELPSAELVPGDLVEVPPGGYFPADGVLLSGTGLQCDESSLTARRFRWPSIRWRLTGTPRRKFRSSIGASQAPVC